VVVATQTGSLIVYDKRLYHTFAWKTLRARVIQRAGGRCEYCGARAVQAHHCTYRYGVLCDPRCLQAVCRSCHERIHGIAPSQRAASGCAGVVLFGFILLALALIEIALHVH